MGNLIKNIAYAITNKDSDIEKRVSKLINGHNGLLDKLTKAALVIHDIKREDRIVDQWLIDNGKITREKLLKLHELQKEIEQQEDVSGVPA